MIINTLDSQQLINKKEKYQTRSNLSIKKKNIRLIATIIVIQKNIARTFYLIEPAALIRSISKSGLIGGYQLDKHPMQLEHYKLSWPQLHSLPQLDDKHPKTDIHSYFDMEFAKVDM